MRNTDHANAAALSWTMLALFGIVTLASLSALGVRPVLSNVMLLPILIALALVAYHRLVRPIPMIAGGMQSFLQFLLIMIFGMFLSFAAAASGFPYRDDLLLGADRAIGFDWFAYARWVDSHPRLVAAYRFAYGSFLVQPLVLMVLLVAHGEMRRLHLFTFAFALSLFVACMVFVFVPAVSVYAGLQVSLDQFDNLRPVSTFEHIRFIEAMRQGTLSTLDPAEGAGLITFPSFHSCGAVLLIWGFWGVRFARIPALLLNLTMLASTPIDGAHYLVDVIGGVSLAAAVLGLTFALERHEAGARLLAWLAPRRGGRTQPLADPG
ncbi:MAG: phosphatase PAP2 family protein [Candidatus Sphingomonas phytovorans]|nr:phosphatase PAP2 family protein [Sphingomonas sp.]WEK02022.1 MAG: phosphatase PAP2 family protein [Sphingomonas sp.]